MSLKEIERKIYKRGEDDPEGKYGSLGHSNPAEKTENPFAPTFFKAEEGKKDSIWIKEEEEKKAKKKKALRIVMVSLSALILLSGAVWGALYVRKSSFVEDMVAISVSGPGEIQSGDVVLLEIDYKNENRSSLRNAVVHIIYSENFKPLDNLNLEPEGPNSSRYNIGTIGGKSEGKIELRGKFFGTKGLLTYVNVKLEYSSSNFSSQFTTEAKHGILISSSPLEVEVNGPQQVSSGGAATFFVKYKNSGQQVIRDLKMKADLPADFSVTTSEPLPASGGGDIWYIGDLGGGESGEIKISGVLSGRLQEEKKFKFSLGEIGNNDAFVAYNDVSKSVKVIGAAITILQTINEKKDALFVNSGDTLSFRVKFKNVSDTALRDLILTEEISSPIIDYASYREFGEARGTLDSNKGTVAWKAPGLKKLGVLNPGEEGELEFSVKLKDIIPVSSTKDKNFSFTALCRIDSPDIPTPEGENKTISGNGIAVKLNSKLIIRQEGYYNDSEIANTGPIPPKVGEETTFSIHLKAENISNDVTDGKIIVTLAPNVSWKENFLPKDADVEYNNRTGVAVWNIGSLPAGVGTITDPKEIVFQVGLNPSVNMVGQYPKLLISTVFSAKDVFTGQNLETKLGEKDTNLLEDLSVGSSGKVDQ
ncbi:MAG: hypothetical protein UX02_C0005G0018 [Candidatus Moranbacteria bacterium GW2011_GWC1_45_18]|nr:MAG: hypothetical protein UT79_C0005G0018 [Candidatus Moranbacteria bacterium GW2011_GWC2_40_12]KKT33048.1 MAG: hypothetical protein UW19_C0012G0020 [Candidatus Moranbacteria bacterium GW2011_GWF2_44_10]KKT72095.1 MAG: hypothetical protein UW66_C0014G0002 [Candidatus Moranbacteria bacterium GW2011_GWF1_44_4]KKT99205.1 MAG: hypothetical protein UX02_C0005G0018 [Candidatus Moranbacteria bacterium GW2011_GWC1_45_18]OGI24649.1 MAG: hypothetical protein A2194_03990 [Candidatus Moranbacteria bacte